MAILLLIDPAHSHVWQQALLAEDARLDVRSWPETGQLDDIEFAIVWQGLADKLSQLPKLRGIASLGAGADHILEHLDPHSQIPVVRVVDDLLTRDMTRYLVSAVLAYQCRFTEFAAQQAQAKWQRKRGVGGNRVGILGFGHLGQAVGKSLRDLGFDIFSWSRHPKQIAGITSYAGVEQLPLCLTQSDILICLLPLTPQTRGILDRELFSLLPQHAYLINVARGEHLVEADLLQALASGQLSGACLDVFQQEPLPAEHPFWQHPAIRVTPHVAAITHPRAVAPQLVDNYYRVLSGQPLLNQVNVQHGY